MTLAEWVKKNPDDAKVLAFWGIIVLAIGAWIFVGVIMPNYRYSQASPAEKCQIDLEKKNDSDKFCDATNSIKSYKQIAQEQQKIAEEQRRAALTPEQRCREDHKSGSDPESGDSFVVICRADGTYDIKSDDEIMADIENELNEDSTSNNGGSGCDPNYSPCVTMSSYDLDCPQIGFTVRVIGSDVHRLDRDGDGLGCE